MSVREQPCERPPVYRRDGVLFASSTIFQLATWLVGDILFVRCGYDAPHWVYLAMTVVAVLGQIVLPRRRTLVARLAAGLGLGVLSIVLVMFLVLIPGLLFHFAIGGHK